VVARVRARENEQHDALGPVQTFVNAHVQVCVACAVLLASASCTRCNVRTATVQSAI